MTLPGSLLSVDDTLTKQGVKEISIEVLPAQHSELLVNIADNFGAGWLDPHKKQLRLQFHLVTIFSKAETDDFCLSISDLDEKISLTPTQSDSPVFGQRFPQLPWAEKSRFVVDEVVDLPDWATSSAKFELFCRASGKSVNIGIIHVSDVCIGLLEEKSTGDGSVVSTSILASVSPSAARPKAINALVSPAITSNPPSYFQRVVDRIIGMNRLFLLTVVIPSLVSGIYFSLIASDIYTSESRFVVRSPQRQAISGLGAIFQGAGFSRSQDDTYSVHDFIFSRDALKILDDELAVDKSFSRSDIDMFSRFAGLDRDNSFEALHRYYIKHVTVDLDSLSSISTLSVNAFTPRDAFQINEKLLEMSENLVNQLNERGRQDMISFASEEVSIAEKKAKSSALAVSNYRNQKGVFDPEKQSALQLQQISKLQDELTATKIQLAQIRALTQDNPQIPSLHQRIETLQTEIDAETAKVAGGDRSLANKSTEYEGLILERGFAEKQLAAALTSLEQARNDAQRKQLYLERIVQPSKPDMAMEPRRIRNVFATFVLGMIAWGILTMLLAGVREHQD